MSDSEWTPRGICAICHEPIEGNGIHPRHAHADHDVYCGTGDGSMATTLDGTYSPFEDLAAVKAANKAKGHHFFDADAMQFFNSMVESVLIRGRYFITSEQPLGLGRRYTVRYANDDGTIDNIGDFMRYETSAEAWTAALQHDASR